MYKIIAMFFNKSINYFKSCRYKFVRRSHNLTGSKLIYNKLLENNVKDVFMYSGGAIMPLIDCFYKGSGPGLTNMVTSLTDATNDSTPMIVLSGQVPLKAMGTLAFQECPATDITKSVTKWSYCVQDTSELGDVMDEAFRISQDGRKN